MVYSEESIPEEVGSGTEGLARVVTGWESMPGVGKEVSSLWSRKKIVFRSLVDLWISQGERESW